MKSDLLKYKLSIITVNKNNYVGLINTLNSLKNSAFQKKIEHVIIDGNSSDLKTSLSDLKNTYNFNFISENDIGIYNAMNKGVGICSNDYVLFLNSGDCFHESSSFLNLSANIGDADLIFGNILDCGQKPSKIISYPDQLTFEYMLCGGLPHQATAIRKSLFENIGYYDEKYKIISDWVFFMEALFVHKVTYKHIPFIISNFEGGGLSSLPSQTKYIVIEQIDYISKRFPEWLKFYYKHSPYVKKYLRQKPRIIRWFYRIAILKFNKIY